MMKNQFIKIACGLCLLLACGFWLLFSWDVPTLGDPDNQPSDLDHRLMHKGQDLSAEAAATLEMELKKNPDDVAARTKLLCYYFIPRFNDDALNELRNGHLLWLIENRPRAGVLGTSFVELDPVDDREEYARAKALWIGMLKKQPNEIKFLEHYANFLS